MGAFPILPWLKLNYSRHYITILVPRTLIMMPSTSYLLESKLDYFSVERNEHRLPQETAWSFPLQRELIFFVVEREKKTAEENLIYRVMYLCEDWVFYLRQLGDKKTTFVMNNCPRLNVRSVRLFVMIMESSELERN